MEVPGSGSLSSGLRAQVYSGYFNDNLSFFGTVGDESNTVDKHTKQVC